MKLKSLYEDQNLEEGLLKNLAIGAAGLGLGIAATKGLQSKPEAPQPQPQQVQEVSQEGKLSSGKINLGNWTLAKAPDGKTTVFILQNDLSKYSQQVKEQMLNLVKKHAINEFMKATGSDMQGISYGVRENKGCIGVWFQPN